jgi:hypothetical protein
MGKNAEIWKKVKFQKTRRYGKITRRYGKNAEIWENNAEIWENVKIS